MLVCPACDSRHIHRSRARTFIERLQKQFRHTRLHRCHTCGWRGWCEEFSADSSQPEQTAPPLDLKALDAKPSLHRRVASTKTD